MVIHIENWYIFFLAFLASFLPAGTSRSIGFVLTGSIFVFYFCPPAWLMLVGSTSLVLLAFRPILRFVLSNHSTLLLILAILGIYFWDWLYAWEGRLDIIPFAFSAFGINTLRYMHVVAYRRSIIINQDNIWNIIAYLWYPPVMFCGPLERYQEFREYHVNQQPRQWFNGLKLWFYGICKGSIVYIIRMAIVEADIDFDKASATILLLKIYLLGFTLMLSLSSWFDFVRGWSCMMGYPFNTPNFHQVHKVKSVASFWTHYNISLTRWLKRHLFYRSLTQFRARDFAAAVFIYFILIGIMKDMTSGFFLWGLLHGAAVLLNFFYIYLKLKFRWLMVFDTRYFPDIIKIIATHIFVLFSWALWYPDWYEQYARLLGRFGFNF